MKTILLISIFFITVPAFAQQPPIQFFRPYDKTGLNIFEPSKQDSTLDTGFKLRVGGSFTQDFQGLKHSNNATPVFVNAVDKNKLIPLTNGFNRAMANLNLDAQLGDGIRMNLTLYLSSRHHEEAWVKGGYIQFDKLLFLKSAAVDRIMQDVTLKIGDYEVDYGDQHFRRTDGGNALLNPFIENYIMDEFATEIGGEVYYHPKSGFIAMAGITNAELNPTVVASSTIDSATRRAVRYSPGFHGKLGFDKQLNTDLRVRLTGSFYLNKSSAGNTLFFGDRTGSHYFYVMENTAATSDGNAWSGRYNPQFSQQLSTFMINPFLKFKGLEFFGTYEHAQGRVVSEPKMRTTIQYAAELIYRFPERNQNFWVGGRYNTVKARQNQAASDVTIDRSAATLGWFVTKNMALKLEYVNQQYKNFAATDIRSGGKFSGFMIEASIGF